MIAGSQKHYTCNPFNNSFKHYFAVTTQPQATRLLPLQPPRATHLPQQATLPQATRLPLQATQPPAPVLTARMHLRAPTSTTKMKGLMTLILPAVFMPALEICSRGISSAWSLLRGYNCCKFFLFWYKKKKKE